MEANPTGGGGEHYHPSKSWLRAQRALEKAQREMPRLESTASTAQTIRFWRIKNPSSDRALSKGFEELHPTPDLNRSVRSYQLKHEIEAWASTYIANGAFIAAVCGMGIDWMAPGGSNITSRWLGVAEEMHGRWLPPPLPSRTLPAEWRGMVPEALWPTRPLDLQEAA